MKLVLPPLYAIMDSTLLTTSELALAEMLARSGVELLQYRNKLASAGALLETSSALVAHLRPFGTCFIVNDRADVAALAGAGGVHVGQEDLNVESARRIVRKSAWVGVSTHSLDQVRAADSTSADYLAVGPIFATGTKQNPDPVVGANFIRDARALTAKPLVAIGGITLERAGELFRAGADSVAVARDLICAADPGARAREYLELAASIRSAAAGN